LTSCRQRPRVTARCRPDQCWLAGGAPLLVLDGVDFTTLAAASVPTPHCLTHSLPRDAGRGTTSKRRQIVNVASIYACLPPRATASIVIGRWTWRAAAQLKPQTEPLRPRRTTRPCRALCVCFVSLLIPSMGVGRRQLINIASIGVIREHALSSACTYSFSLDLYSLLIAINPGGRAATDAACLNHS